MEIRLKALPVGALRKILWDFGDVCLNAPNDASEDVIRITVPPNLSKLEREAFYRSLNDHDGDIYIVGKDGKTFLGKK